MIRQTDDGYELLCDDCEDVLENEDGDTVFETFGMANEMRKELGWLTGKNKRTDKWFNLCTVCREDKDIRKKHFGE